jgi:hypothetical protein
VGKLTAQGVRDLGHPFYRTDAIDLGIASAELAAGRAALRQAYEIHGRQERRAAIDAALGKLTLAIRAIEAVVERRT